jgi:hypothetical protein
MDTLYGKMPATDVLIEHGANAISLAVVGHPVEKVRRSVAETLNVPAHAAAFVNGQRANGEQLLQAGDCLCFLVERGRKGILSPEELEKLALPKEVTTKEAAQILGCDPKTVLKYLRSGLLAWRNIAPPTSTRAEFRFELKSVLAVRSAYRTTPLVEDKYFQTPRRNVVSTSASQPRHIKLD